MMGANARNMSSWETLLNYASFIKLVSFLNYRDKDARSHNPQKCVGLLSIKYYLIFSKHNWYVWTKFSKLGNGQNFREICFVVLESLEILSAPLKAVHMALTQHAQDWVTSWTESTSDDKQTITLAEMYSSL
jgi:hypothetical protein